MFNLENKIMLVDWVLVKEVYILVDRTNQQRLKNRELARNLEKMLAYKR